MGGAPVDATGSSLRAQVCKLLPNLVNVHDFYGADEGKGVWREGGWFSGMDSGDQVPGTRREAEEWDVLLNRGCRSMGDFSWFV